MGTTRYIELYCVKCGAIMSSMHLKSFPVCFYCNEAWRSTEKTYQEIQEENREICSQDLDLFYDEIIRRNYVYNNPLFERDIYEARVLQEEEEGDETNFLGDRYSYLNGLGPKCPTCSSTNVQRIGAGEKVASAGLFGLFSSKIHKSYKCNNCKYMW